MLLNCLEKPLSTVTGETIASIRPNITEEEYLEILNKTQEDTGSHRPLHYGYFKAACKSQLVNELTYYPWISVKQMAADFTLYDLEGP